MIQTAVESSKVVATMRIAIMKVYEVKVAETIKRRSVWIVATFQRRDEIVSVVIVKVEKLST